MHNIDSGILNRPISENRGWRDVLDSLHNEIKGYGYLARFASIAKSISKDPFLDRRVVIYKNRAYKALHDRFRRERPENLDTSTASAIYAVMSAEVACGGFDAASIHASVLSQFCETQPPTSEVIKILNFALWSDVQRASMTLTRPCFDVRGWVAKRIPNTWEPLLEPDVWQRHHHVQPLDEGIEHPGLILQFCGIRLVQELQGVMLRQPELAFTNADICAWLSTRALICEGTLLNHYVDFRDELARKEMLPKQRGSRTLLEACTTLAALLYVRSLSRTENLGIGSKLDMAGSQVYSARRRITTEMRSLIVEWRSTRGSKAKPAEARLCLWMFYIGAMAELATPNESDNGPPFFSSLFVHQAQSMGILTWSAVRPILTGFLYTDGFRPHGSTFFSQLVARAAVGAESERQIFSLRGV